MPVVTDDQIVSLHTFNGVQLHQFLGGDYADCTWGRRQRDASSCSLSLPPLPGLERLPEIVPWLHWVSVWDGERDVLLWTGPVQKITASRRGLSLEAKDHAAYAARTRNPITKRWDGADPAWIAGELWRHMVEVQGLNQRPIVRPDPEGERFDFQVLADDQLLDQTLKDLVGLGLRWAVVSGVPVIGPVSLEPVATLGEDDFLGDGISLVRDGSATYNDVLVRGPDNLARARTDYHGQNLQALVNLDDMFGVSNVRRAAQQYVRHTGAVRTRLELGSATVLHPDAPVHIDELMPSARFVIEAAGVRQLVELTDVEVERRSGQAAVKVTMESLPDRDAEGNLIELAQEQSRNQPTVTLGGQALGR
ncbi:minor tail protein [Mycobacterium phage Saguaro]|uniref:Minor tail protein n=1 Tax=Mycobacterium phage Saguaro TaxID=2315616 RepID=A0A386K9X0_9CAUD|nr:minor tail protein [Mycobacterium phage Saguaro]AYD82025.1 minor tail protein [Mycobacterium phage Saguaro]